MQGSTNAFVSKLSFNRATSTLTLSYSTYLGGSGVDEGEGITLDSAGDAYVTGDTESSDFPTVNPLPAPNNVLHGIANAFISKLRFNRATSTLSLAYSTYLGGSGSDVSDGIAVDASGNAYVTGFTTSPDFPTAHPLPAPNNAMRGIEDAFVSKLSFDRVSSTLSLTYSTYLGGTDLTQGLAIAVDALDHAYVTGGTRSTGFPIVHPLPASNNAVQGLLNAFVSKLIFDRMTSTLSLAYSTYLGGSGDDAAAGIAVDASGNACVTGFTSSPDFPTLNELPAALSGTPSDFTAFVAKLRSPEARPECPRSIDAGFTHSSQIGPRTEGELHEMEAFDRTVGHRR